MDNKLIFDIGMHIGQDTAYYLSRGFRVVAVEANPLLAQEGGVRFKSELDEGRLAIENVGISQSEGISTFWICDEMLEWSSFHRESAARRGYKHHSIEVPCIRLPDLIARHGLPYYMKIDIEGHDYLCLRQLKQQKLPRYISVESYGPKAIEDLFDLGYRQFKIIDQICFSALETPPTIGYRLYWGLRNFRERSHMVKDAYASRAAGKLGGRYVVGKVLYRYRRRCGWTFADGASGPFGDDTPGKWLAASDAITTLRTFNEWFRSTNQAPEKRWFDIHAKI